ncbi:hypothetical protein EIK77_009688 [Talaromyces pinophilus]|nr:hypothetical protein EIK77_009688 [Talaromyces pinophilus]
MLGLWVGTQKASQSGMGVRVLAPCLRQQQPAPSFHPESRADNIFSSSIILSIDSKSRSIDIINGHRLAKIPEHEHARLISNGHIQESDDPFPLRCPTFQPFYEEGVSATAHRPWHIRSDLFGYNSPAYTSLIPGNLNVSRLISMTGAFDENALPERGSNDAQTRFVFPVLHGIPCRDILIRREMVVNHTSFAFAEQKFTVHNISEQSSIIFSQCSNETPPSRLESTQTEKSKQPWKGKTQTAQTLEQITKDTPNPAMWEAMKHLPWAWCLSTYL